MAFKDLWRELGRPPEPPARERTEKPTIPPRGMGCCDICGEPLAPHPNPSLGDAGLLVCPKGHVSTNGLPGGL